MRRIAAPKCLVLSLVTLTGLSLISVTRLTDDTAAQVSERFVHVIRCSPQDGNGGGSTQDLPSPPPSPVPSPSLSFNPVVRSVA